MKVTNLAIKYRTSIVVLTVLLVLGGFLSYVTIPKESNPSIEIPNPDGRIKPEMVATVFVTRATLSDVYVVPRPALIREESGFMVYTVDRSTSAPVAERRPVVTGSSYGNEVVIQSGLTDGDEVVVQGQNNVSQGERLDVVEVHQAVEATAEPGEADLSVLPPAP